MKKIISRLVIGLVLLSAGIILSFSGRRHHSKALIVAIPGFILSAAYGLTFLQVRKQYSKSKNSDNLLDQE